MVPQTTASSDLRDPASVASPAKRSLPEENSSERHANCFDALRLLLAVSVLYSHSYFVGGFGDERFLRLCKGQTIAGTIGVLGFFGLSGFLVALSCARCRTPWEFLRRRALRILPGYWVCLIVTAFIAAPLIASLNAREGASVMWTGENSPAHYVARNSLLFIRQWTIGEVLTGLPQPGSLNGSLWSLFPEACCYLGLSFAAGCGALHAQRGLLVFITGAVAAFHFAKLLNPALDVPTLPTFVVLTQLTPFVLAFLVGAVASVYRERLVFNPRGAVLLGILFIGTLRFGGFNLLAPVLLPMLLLQIGHSFTFRLRHDFSYGLYIYGFVAQQIVVALPSFRGSATIFFLVSSLLALAFAMASWFGVERWFLIRTRGV